MTISVLAPIIREQLNLTNLQFAGLGTWFLLAYTISQVISGKLYDRFGTRAGFIGSVFIWSVAALLHSIARGLTSLSLFRFILGAGEAGNWPGAAKVVAEWFPIHERAFGLAIFNSGAVLGSVFALPFIVWLQIQYGWQATFIITGALGFFWLLGWMVIYHSPKEHPWITEEESAYIEKGQWKAQDFHLASAMTTQETIPVTAKAPSWLNLLRQRKVWAIIIARFLVDPVWWLYIIWLPEYLVKARGFQFRESA